MAIAYFNEHYSESISIEEYAEKNHVSTSWFIRNFKLYVGSTPMQFILQKSICNAEALLLNTEYNINEIAQIVGYDNALYFSRMFKKIKGISPEYYGAAEPPVRCGESHLSGLTEPLRSL